MTQPPLDLPDDPDVTGSAADFLPRNPGLDSLREASQTCRGCGLYRNATQAVFGEGSAGADVMLVGEQPGDKEDLAGAPFVGPAGRLLDTALREAGIERTNAYVTNVVKHFKWKRSPYGGKRRLHDKPNAAEITACRPWLEAEIAQVRPKILVCLGATAAQAILGAAIRVTRDRGQLYSSDLGPLVMATVHPSSILRAPDEAAREREMAELIRDLARIPEHLSAGSPGPVAAG